jgi:asparagine synthase (glutamine-hydrolysing)
MCRIYGYAGGRAIEPSVLDRVGAAMLHGGPDAQTWRAGPDGALGSNRLAIQGIAHGAQPFRRDGLTCVFNGEIYNHRALRAELAGQGCPVAGDCDGSVLLPLYQRYGDSFVTRLEGMFAIAISDDRERCLKLYSDPAGMKSLYYYLSPDGKRLAFASELTALSLFPGFPAGIDPLAIDRYLGGKAVWGPGTIYAGVRTLPPGTALRFGGAGLTVSRILPEPGMIDWPDGTPSLAGAARLLDAMLREELARMTDADVPVCVVTSGGLDSSYLTALTRRLVPDLASFNIAYAGQWPADERWFGEQVAAHCGTRHHQVIADPAGFPQLIERFVRHLDQPNNAPHSLSTFALFEAIHQAGFKVALTGDGADELFGGYARYVKASRDDSTAWHRAYQDTMAAVGTRLLTRMYSPAFRAAIEQAGGYFADRSGDELARRAVTGQDAKLDALLRYDQDERFPYYILRRVDHLSMAHAVEARIPFLQPRVVRFARALPAGLKVADDAVKAPVAQAAHRWLPVSITGRPKQPFTLPIAAMIRPGEALYEMIGDLVVNPASRRADVFDQKTISELFDMQTENPSAHTAEALWSLLILESWLSARGVRV